MFKKILIGYILLLLGVFAMCAGENKKQIIKKISSKEGYQLIQQKKDDINFVILDVRTPEEFNDGHIDRAININLNSNDFKDQINKLDKNKIYVVYCRSGHRSGNAVKIMKDLKFMEVYDIGGIIQWEDAGYKLVK
jgi:phage shock protein E